MVPRLSSRVLVMALGVAVAIVSGLFLAHRSEQGGGGGQGAATDSELGVAVDRDGHVPFPAGYERLKLGMTLEDLYAVRGSALPRSSDPYPAAVHEFRRKNEGWRDVEYWFSSESHVLGLVRFTVYMPADEGRAALRERAVLLHEFLGRPTYWFVDQRHEDHFVVGWRKGRLLVLLRYLPGENVGDSFFSFVTSYFDADEAEVQGLFEGFMPKSQAFSLQDERTRFLSEVLGLSGEG